jgi:hypothetical protein
LTTTRAGHSGAQNCLFFSQYHDWRTEAMTFPETFDDLLADDQDRVLDALEWFGESAFRSQDVDLCESGQAYLGMREILPRGTIRAHDYC